MIVLPTPRLAMEFAWLQAPLPQIIGDIMTTAERQGYDYDMCVTSIYRSYQEDTLIGGSGVHATIPHRAIDIKMGWEWVSKIAMVINRQWVYDPQRPRYRVVMNKKHGTAPHLHVQVHSRTVTREDMQMARMA